MKKAHDIQLGCQTDVQTEHNLDTLRLIASCYLKLKDYEKALEFSGKLLATVDKKMGKNSKEYAKASVDKAKILITEGKSHC